VDSQLEVLPPLLATVVRPGGPRLEPVERTKPIPTRQDDGPAPARVRRIVLGGRMTRDGRRCTRSKARSQPARIVLALPASRSTAAQPRQRAPPAGSDGQHSSKGRVLARRPKSTSRARERGGGERRGAPYWPVDAAIVTNLAVRTSAWPGGVRSSSQAPVSTLECGLMPAETGVDGVRAKRPPAVRPPSRGRAHA
jgi:hypothetical protein